LSNGEIVKGDALIASILCIKISLVIEEKSYVMQYSCIIGVKFQFIIEVFYD